MIAALGSLASWAVPKLLTFASKKLFSSPLGQQVHKDVIILYLVELSFIRTQVLEEYNCTLLFGKDMIR